MPRGGDRFWPEPDQIEECRQRGEAAIEHLRSAPYDVVGRLDDLRVPDEREPRRSTSSVTEAEVAAVAVDLVATMLDDVRRLRRRSRPRPDPAPGLLGRLRRVGRRG